MAVRWPMVLSDSNEDAPVVRYCGSRSQKFGMRIVFETILFEKRETPTFPVYYFYFCLQQLLVPLAVWEIIVSFRPGCGFGIFKPHKLLIPGAAVAGAGPPLWAHVRDLVAHRRSQDPRADRLPRGAPGRT